MNYIEGIQVCIMGMGDQTLVLVWIDAKDTHTHSTAYLSLHLLLLDVFVEPGSHYVLLTAAMLAYFRLMYPFGVCTNRCTLQWISQQPMMIE